MKSLKPYFMQKRQAFSGLNHVLIAILIFLLLLLIPIEPFSSFIKTMTQDPIVAVMSFLIVCGAALLPDLDNMKGSDGGSTAGYELGVIGSIISSMMVTISSIFTSLCQGKKDERVTTQHRYFWHTGIVPLLILLLVYFFAPDGTETVYKAFDTTSAASFAISLPLSTVLCLLSTSICVYIATMLLLRKLSTLVSIKYIDLIAILAMCVSFAVCLNTTLTGLKLITYCIALGYLFHEIGDLFSDTGIPLLFPLTGVVGSFWKRTALLPKSITIKTGSPVESLLKIVFVVIDIFLLYMVFTQNGV